MAEQRSLILVAISEFVTEIFGFCCDPVGSGGREKEFEGVGGCEGLEQL